jgi:phosphoribosylaminoimidazole-succinocarboxamide synthase
VDEGDHVVRFSEIKKPSCVMEINLVNVHRPEARMENGKLKYGYGVYTPRLTNYLIPLEIIYRNGLPEGSSVFKRLEQGSVTFTELGLDHHPKPSEKLQKPIFDVSTKLEESDRYLAWAEAQRIAGLTDNELKEVKTLLLRIDDMITKMAADAGLVNEDGKIELAFDPLRRLMVVDVVGTLDECRFTYDGLHVSKEIARQYYMKTQWFREVDEVKKNARVQGVEDWRKLVRTKPPKLDPPLKTAISQVYKSAANEITKKKLFDVRPLSEVLQQFAKKT